ncbi:hypothetical protein SORBI_3004G140900 [Sorghum bicolor]|uniref:Uncharacterized protein n=1 Tax=Sorghum bicolor TaxID=4558 RepID=A0A194YQR7_SORBI|nr:hypothetical protein SORBI_3004G140900 [Sorghum bicolor]
MVIHVLQKGSTNVEIVQFGISIVEITFLNVVAVKGTGSSLFYSILFSIRLYTVWTVLRRGAASVLSSRQTSGARITITIRRFKCRAL